MGDLRQAERLVAPGVVELDVTSGRKVHEELAEAWGAGNVLGDRDVLSALHRLLLPRHAAARVEERQLAPGTSEGEAAVLLAHDCKFGSISQENPVRQATHVLADLPDRNQGVVVELSEDLLDDVWEAIWI